jgi:RNA-binding protein NOB1
MIEHLVVDSGGFLRNCPIQEMCQNAYTVPGVVAEIRDKPTRDRLKVLPYELKFRDPSAKSISAVSKAANESGDFASLSAVDLKVLALTYELTVEHDSEKQIRETLKQLTTKVVIGQDEEEKERLKAENIPGFYKGNEDSDEETEKDREDEEEEEEEDDDDWITPDNIKEIDEGDALEEEKEDVVACLTIDFAMQNVLLKMDLGRIGLEGRKITQVRKYIRRCTGCYFQDKTASKVFCPSCGHKTMRRVACEVQPDGTLKLFLAKNPKCLNSRGTVYNLPAPKGGKYAKNPVLTDMQPMPQQKMSRKAMMRENPSAADFEAWGNPFSVNDVESKSFRLGYGLNGTKFKNPNQNKSKGKRRK